jgi:hypothetical protein
VKNQEADRLKDCLSLAEGTDSHTTYSADDPQADDGEPLPQKVQPHFHSRLLDNLTDDELAADSSSSDTVAKSPDQRFVRSATFWLVAGVLVLIMHFFASIFLFKEATGVSESTSVYTHKGHTYVDVDFKYYVDGKKYIGHKETGEQDAQETYQSGRKITVYYDPLFPLDSALARLPSIIDWYWQIVVPIIFLFFLQNFYAKAMRNTN